MCESHGEHSTNQTVQTIRGSQKSSLLSIPSARLVRETLLCDFAGRDYCSSRDADRVSFFDGKMVLVCTFLSSICVFGSANKPLKE